MFWNLSDISASELIQGWFLSDNVKNPITNNVSMAEANVSLALSIDVIGMEVCVCVIIVII